MSLFTDGVSAAVEFALDGVAERQRASSANVANAATPGYHARRVLFEDDLAAAIAGGRTAHTTDVDAGTPERIDGNSVQLEDEVAILTKSSLQYQALVNALTFKLSLIHTAIR